MSEPQRLPAEQLAAMEDFAKREVASAGWEHGTAKTLARSVLTLAGVLRTQQAELDDRESEIVGEPSDDGSSGAAASGSQFPRPRMVEIGRSGTAWENRLEEAEARAEAAEAALLRLGPEAREAIAKAEAALRFQQQRADDLAAALRAFLADVDEWQAELPLSHDEAIGIGARFIERHEKPLRAALAAGVSLVEQPPRPCEARRVHPMSTDYFVACSLKSGHEGEHSSVDGVRWADDSKWALAVVEQPPRGCYCGFLDWTIKQHGRLTHKHGCQARVDAFCQSHPDGCPTEVSMRSIPGPDPGACPDCGGWRRAGMTHSCDAERERQREQAQALVDALAVVEQPPRPTFCEATPKPCQWPACDCDCDCFIPTLEGAGQHSPGCRSIKRQAVVEQPPPDGQEQSQETAGTRPSSGTSEAGGPQ